MENLRKSKHFLAPILTTLLANEEAERRVKTEEDHRRQQQEKNKYANVIARLDGKLQHEDNSQKGLPTESVKDFVSTLIREATSFENLKNMYWGWKPFL